MILIDYAIIAIIISSALVSFLRGFIQESLSLLCWGLGLYIASNYYSFLAILLTSFKSVLIRNMISVFLLFIFFLIIETILNHFISKLIKKIGYSSTNKMLGVFFGSIRGLLIVIIVLFALSIFTNMSYNECWQHSQLVPYFYSVINYCLHVVYDDSNILL